MYYNDPTHVNKGKKKRKELKYKLKNHGQDFSNYNNYIFKQS